MPGYPGKVESAIVRLVQAAAAAKMEVDAAEEKFQALRARLIEIASERRVAADTVRLTGIDTDAVVRFCEQLRLDTKKVQELHAKLREHWPTYFTVEEKFSGTAALRSALSDGGSAELQKVLKTAAELVPGATRVSFEPKAEKGKS